MAKKESLITGVDIGSHAVKICQLQKTGKGYKVLAVGTASIPAGAVEDGVLQEPEAVSKALAALLKNLKIKNHKIGISISGWPSTSGPRRNNTSRSTSKRSISISRNFPPGKRARTGTTSCWWRRRKRW